MNYTETLSFLEALQPKAFRMELGPVTEAAHLLGNPQEAFPVIHISGTNGKGSTAAFLSSIFETSGYRVGLYTSPHLVDVRERIRVNGEAIDEETFAGLTARLRAALPDERMLSYFEFLTLAAAMHFRDVDVNAAIFETGLGGRLDATNIVHPKVAIITPISFDHTRHLGSTLKDIAEEKCGIITRGSPTVVAYQPPEVMEVVRRYCDDVGSPLCLATPDEIRTPLGLAGEHQRQNAACAVEAAQLLEGAGLKVARVDEALAAATWPGRLETIHQSPRVVLDAAHNVAGAEALASYIRSEFPRERVVLMLGAMADKDIGGMVRALAPLVREVLCVRADTPRAASPKDLAALVRSSGTTVEVLDAIPAALDDRLARLAKEDALVVAGSLHVIGEAKAYFSEGK